MSKPALIVITGAPSSGKSSVARLLVEKLARPSIHLDSDTFRKMLASGSTPFVELEAMGEGNHLAFARAFHRTAAAFHLQGLATVVDHTLYPRAWLEDCAVALAEFSPLLVGIKCAPSTLAARERDRGDRVRGLAVQIEQAMHVDSHYDLSLDSTSIATDALVASIVERWHQGGFSALSAIRRASGGAHAETSANV